MIAIGGAIGTGLFLLSGGAISAAGPGGAMILCTIVIFVRTYGYFKLKLSISLVLLLII